MNTGCELMWLSSLNFSCQSAVLAIIASASPASTSRAASASSSAATRRAEKPCACSIWSSTASCRLPATRATVLPSKAS